MMLPIARLSSNDDALFRRAYQRVCGWDAREQNAVFNATHDEAYKQILLKIQKKEQELKEQHDSLNQRQENLLKACRRAYEHEVVLEGLKSIVQALDAQHFQQMNLMDIENMLENQRLHYAAEYQKEMQAFEQLVHDTAGAPVPPSSSAVDHPHDHENDPHSSVVHPSASPSCPTALARSSVGGSGGYISGRSERRSRRL